LLDVSGRTTLPARRKQRRFGSILASRQLQTTIACSNALRWINFDEINYHNDKGESGYRSEKNLPTMNIA
jgi:hypothetical protein